MLTVGQTAKDFTLSDKQNKKVSLSDFKGKKVALYFYPKDDTPGCTRQACAFRDAYGGFSDRNVVVIGISQDSVISHQKFAEKYQLPFLLLSDPDKKVIKDYDVSGLMGAQRTTYVIDENGVIEMVFPKATPATNAADILEYLNQ